MLCVFIFLGDWGTAMYVRVLSSATLGIEAYIMEVEWI